MESYTIYAKTNSEGKLLIYSKGEWNEWLRQNPNKILTATFEARTNKDTSQIIKFYWGYVIVRVQEGFYKMGCRMRDSEINRLLKNEYYKPIDSIDELDTLGWKDYIDWIRQYAAENLDTFIHDAKTN